MIAGLAELAAALDDVINVGESLKRNLEGQRVSILAWDSEALLRHLDTREHLIRRLGEIQGRCMNILTSLPVNDPFAGLAQLITVVPAHSPEQQLLRDLQQRTRKLFTDLLADEQRLHAFKENLLALLHDAFNRLLEKDATVYGETGNKSIARVGLGLVYEKA